MGVDKAVKNTELNGRTVSEEKRSEVRLSKTQGRDARSVAYKIAVDKSDLEDAYGLVWDNYVKTGLQQDDGTGIRFTKYHLLPDTRVFVAKFHEALAAERPDQLSGDGTCVGTVTLIIDGPMGLPMEEFCGDEISKMRNEGRKVAEVVAFALDPKYTRYKVFLHMFKLLFQFAEMKGVTDLCCSVTERHISFYRKVCLFEPIGELMPYSGAYKLKVQGHRLDIAEAKGKAKKFYAGREFDADLHRFFFTESFNRKAGEGAPLSEEMVKYFSHDRTNFIDTLADQDLNVLRSEYDDIGMNFPF